VSLSPLAKKYNFNAELTNLSGAINATLSNNTANRTSDPLILALAAVAYANFGRVAYANRLVSYLKQYQSPSGALSLSSSYPLLGQTLFGSSPRDAQVILAGYAAQAFALTGNDQNAILADMFLSTQVNVAGLLGGNQATIVGASTIISQLPMLRKQTDDARFGIFLNNVRASKSFPYEDHEMGILTTVTMEGPQNEGLDEETAQEAGLLPGAVVKAQLRLIGVQPSEKTDFAFGYWLAGIY
jgi:hypothetical protein